MTQQVRCPFVFQPSLLFQAGLPQCNVASAFDAASSVVHGALRQQSAGVTKGPLKVLWQVTHAYLVLQPEQQQHLHCPVMPCSQLYRR